MGKLAARDNGTHRQFKPQIYQSRRRGKSRNFYDSHNYDRGNYQKWYRSDSFDRRNYYRQSRGRPRYEQNYRRRNFRGNVRLYQDFGRQNSRGEYRGNYRKEDYSWERGRSRSRERSFSRNNNDNRKKNRSISDSRSRSGSRGSTNRDRIRCYKCKEYDHFTKDCPTSKEGEKEQIKELFILDEKQTSLKTFDADTYVSLNKMNSLENIIVYINYSIATAYSFITCWSVYLIEDNDPIAFLPLHANIGGQIRSDKNLMEEQARHVHKKGGIR